jgi:hypothetical protein
VLAVTARADTDPDSAQALAQLLADRLAAFNDLLKPSGVQVTDELIASAVEHWLAAPPGEPG